MRRTRTSDQHPTAPPWPVQDCPLPGRRVDAKKIPMTTCRKITAMTWYASALPVAIGDRDQNRHAEHLTADSPPPVDELHQFPGVSEEVRHPGEHQWNKAKKAPPISAKVGNIRPASSRANSAPKKICRKARASPSCSPKKCGLG